jgi:hypothetical protein
MDEFVLSSGRLLLAHLSSSDFQTPPSRQRGSRQPVTQQERSAAQRLRTTMAAMKLASTGLHDGQPKVFSDSALENLREFFERFRRLNIRSGPELDALVEQAQQTINGIEPQTLRDSNRLRQMVARDFERIQASVGELLVDRPRRNILRRRCLMAVGPRHSEGRGGGWLRDCQAAQRHLLPAAVPDASAFLTALETRRCRTGLA